MGVALRSAGKMKSSCITESCRCWAHLISTGITVGRSSWQKWGRGAEAGQHRVEAAAPAAKGLLAGVNNALLPTDLRSDTDPPLYLGSFSGCHGPTQVQWRCKTLWRAEQLGLVQFGLILSREPRYFNTHCHNRGNCNICLFLGHSPLYLFASFYILLLCY